MPRRVKLPGASELFRSTGTDGPAPTEALEPASAQQPPADTRGPGASGRVRHEEKITVYVSREELLAIEQARLRLRGEVGLAVDRGRLVRAAVALALADLDAAGEHGELVRRLTAS